MIKAFKQIPEALQRQILYRLGYGIAILFVTITLFFYTGELFSVLACFLAMIFCIISAFALFRRAVIVDYIVISGECIGIGLTLVKRRTKMITLCTDDNKILKVMLKQRLRKFKEGSKITLYVATNVPVYEKNGVHLLYSYLAIEAKGK